MPFIVATYVYACSPRAAQAIRSDQNVPKYLTTLTHCKKSPNRQVDNPVIFVDSAFDSIKLIILKELELY